MTEEESPDYYFLPNGLMVFTEAYLLKRGYCCGSGCRHCPYDYEKVEEPRRTQLLEQKKKSRRGERRP